MRSFIGLDLGPIYLKRSVADDTSWKALKNEMTAEGNTAFHYLLRCSMLVYVSVIEQLVPHHKRGYYNRKEHMLSF